VEEVGFGEMAEGLSAGRFDVVASGIWISPDRARVADFTTPLLYDAVFPFVRSDDHRFDAKLDAANDPKITISTIDGEMAATIASADFPRAKTLSLPQSTDFTQMILNVASSRADLTFLALGPAEKYMRANPGQLRRLSADQPTRLFPTAIMLPQGEYSLKRSLDLVINDMLNTGEAEKIIAKYEETPGEHLRVARPFQLPGPAATTP
jgi:ABC-type amino acid transport substrate-binding protein